MWEIASKWDWIQWYYFIWIGFEVIASIGLNGQPRKNYNAGDTLVGLILLLPVIGRVAGIW